MTRLCRLLVVVAMGAIICSSPSPASAQVEPAGSLSLTGQTTFVRPGGFFDLELRVGLGQVVVTSW